MWEALTVHSSLIALNILVVTYALLGHSSLVFGLWGNSVLILLCKCVVLFNAFQLHLNYCVDSYHFLEPFFCSVPLSTNVWNVGFLWIENWSICNVSILMNIKWCNLQKKKNSFANNKICMLNIAINVGKIYTRNKT